MNLQQVLETYYYNFHSLDYAIVQYPWKFIVPLTAVSLYLLALWVIPKMLHKSVPGIEPVITIWNLFLTIFSFLSFHGCGYYIIRANLQKGFHMTLCSDMLLEKAGGLQFWGFGFMISKYLELFDTIFTLMKHPDKKIDFLHWWHHITVLAFTQFCVSEQYDVGLYFMLMNALVHTIMYYYYFLASIGHKPSWAMVLTILQILQMIFGILLNLYFTIYCCLDPSESCSKTRPNLLLWACAFMYGSYLYLFCEFFYKKYIKRGDHLANKKQSIEKSKAE